MAVFGPCNVGEGLQECTQRSLMLHARNRLQLLYYFPRPHPYVFSISDSFSWASQLALAGARKRPLETLKFCTEGPSVGWVE